MMYCIIRTTSVVWRRSFSGNPIFTECFSNCCCAKDRVAGKWAWVRISNGREEKHNFFVWAPWLNILGIPRYRQELLEKVGVEKTKLTLQAWIITLEKVRRISKERKSKMCEEKIDTNNERIHQWNELDSHAEQTRERWDQVEVTRSDAMDNSQHRRERCPITTSSDPSTNRYSWCNLVEREEARCIFETIWNFEIRYRLWKTLQAAKFP